MANLNKTVDLVAKVAEKMGTPKTKAKEVVDTVVESMVDLILDETHDGLDIFRFTRWEKVQVPERECRNPQTGDTIISKAHKKVTPKASKRLKDAVR